jgi:hypothetical protein
VLRASLSPRLIAQAQQLVDVLYDLEIWDGARLVAKVARRPCLRATPIYREKMKEGDVVLSTSA